MKSHLELKLLIIALSLFTTVTGQHMNTKRIAIGTDTLSYTDTEKGNLTLVFIHGSFIDKAYWEDQVSYFSSRYRVIAIDMAGHGESTKNGNDWTIKRFGNDINEFIEKLSLENVVLIGHSIGCEVILETVFDTHSSVAGIIAIDYFKNVGFELPEDFVGQVISGLETDFANTSEQYAKQALLTPATKKEISERVMHDYRTMDPQVGIAMNKDYLRYTKREMELLKALNHKLYIINVNYSPTNENALNKVLGNNYELINLNGTCHFPMLEIPEQLNIEIENALSKINN